MKKYPWFRFWPSVWLSDPHLKQCKWEGKGLLADLMALAHNGAPRGYITNGGLPLSGKEIAKNFGETVRKTVKLLQILDKKGRICIQPDGTMYIPSMVRETELLDKAQRDGTKGGNPNLLPPLNPPVNPPLNPTVIPEVEVEANQIKSDANQVRSFPVVNKGKAKRKRQAASDADIETRRQQLIQQADDLKKRSGSAVPTSIGDLLDTDALAHQDDSTEPTKEKAPVPVEDTEAHQVGGDLV